MILSSDLKLSQHGHICDQLQQKKVTVSKCSNMSTVNYQYYGEQKVTATSFNLTQVYTVQPNQSFLELRWYHNDHLEEEEEENN